VGSDCTQRYEGPPPSDSGYYVLAQIEPKNPSPDPGMGHILIAAQDLFFSLAPVAGASELLRYYQQHLGADYRVERAPTQIRIANRDFVRLDYGSAAAGLHWRVLATEIRCHVVQFIFTGSNPRSLERLIENMKTMIPPSGTAPLCLKDFATPEAVLEREEPVLAVARFNPVPVRIVIDKNGRVEHIHFLSAFPEQAKSISDALLQWRFKPYLQNGQPVEVETGLLFGRSARQSAAALH
ncbi:MAG TPA: energy transducer TonB, partial [Steroidobacteraceae bacterium]